MRKSTRIVKRTLALFLVVLMGINTMGAVVSDNDGSAFITKAEFDSLKNNFQSQIDQYNTSIDSKIDGAIAGYLAGFRISTELTANLITKNWQEVSCWNGVYVPTFSYPNFDAIVSVSDCICVFRPGQSWGTDKIFQTVNVALKTSYNCDGDADKNIRPTVTGGVESATDPTKDVVWNGIALDYKENYTITRNYFSSGLQAGSIGLAFFQLDNAGSSVFGTNFQLMNTSAVLLPDGYYPRLNDLGDVSFNPSFGWRYQSGGGSWSTWVDMDLTSYVVADNFTTSIALGAVDNNQKKYEHILQYNADDAWTVSDETFTKTFSTRSNNNCKSDSFLSALDKDKHFVWMGEKMQSKVSTTVGCDWAHGNKTTDNSNLNYMNGAAGDDPNDLILSDNKQRILPSIGMYPDDLQARMINQFGEKIIYEIDGHYEEIKPLSLEKGLPLFWAKNGWIIEWEPKFIQGLKTNTAGEWIADNGGVKIALSIGPFGNKQSANQIISISSDNGVTYQNSAEISSTPDTVKIKFTMPSDGVVYAKWWSNNADPDADPWVRILDLASCGTFKYTKEN